MNLQAQTEVSEENKRAAKRAAPQGDEKLYEKKKKDGNIGKEGKNM